MAHHLDDYFRRSLTDNTTATPSDFGEALFSDMPWSFHSEIDGETPLDVSGTEREQVLHSLRDYAAALPPEGVEISGARITPIETGRIHTIEAGTVDAPALIATIPALIRAIETGEGCHDHCRHFSHAPKHDLKRIASLIQHHQYKIMFVNDSARPADERGKETLKRMIAAMKLVPSEYSVSFIVRCPGDDIENRSIRAQHCMTYLWSEIALLKPAVVVSFGAFATEQLLGTKEKMAQVHGKFFKRRIQEHEWMLVPLWAPAYLDENVEMKKAAWEDMKKIMQFLGKA